MSEPGAGPAAHRVQVTIDCADPQAMADFWQLALGYIEQPPPEEYPDWNAFADAVGIPVEDRDRFGAVVDPAGQGPRLLFQKVPEGKVVKNRVHLDIDVGAKLTGDERKPAVREHAQRLVAVGATLVGERTYGISWWIVLTDPEGNEFCLQ